MLTIDIPGARALRPGRALRLALFAIAPVGCVSVHGIQAPAEVSTHFLYFKKQDDAYLGGVGSLLVEVAPNPSRRAPVRFAETVSGGTGDAWRSTLWMALLSASAVLDIDPMSLRVTVEADGAVDGPSAGALLTAVIVAAVQRDPVLPDAILTGIINPDLTVGPVGGIPEKVAAALEAGKRRIGIPVGQHSSPSLSTRQPVDVMALVRAKGGEAFVVRDVGDAYHVLTGKTLPEPDALDEEQMRLPPWASAVFSVHAENLLQQMEAADKDLAPLVTQINDRRLVAERTDLIAEGRQTRELIARGETVAALYLAAQAQAGHLYLSTRLLTDIGAHLGKWEYLRNMYRGLHGAVAMLLDSSMPDWKAYVPRDAIEVPYAVDTFEAFIHALREYAEANEVLKRHALVDRFVNEDQFVPANEADRAELLKWIKPFFTRLLSPQSNLLLGKAYLEVGKAWLAQGRQQGRVPIPSAVLKSLSTEYEQVADANLEYVDTLLVREDANQRGENPEITRRRLVETDSDYRQAVINRRLPEFLGKAILTDAEHILADLSGAVSSYFASVTVVSKRYSLGAVFDEGGERIVSVRHDAALQSMLRLAERQARQVASRCQRLLGEVPISTLIEYELGRHSEKSARLGANATARDRETSVQRRIEALSHLWRASTLGRLALVAHRRMDGAGSAHER